MDWREKNYGILFADVNAVDKDLLPQTHRVSRPAVYFTDLVFKHSRSMTSINSTNTSNDGL